MTSSWDINNYKRPSDDSTFYGTESHFNKDVIFYQDVRLHGDLKFDFLKLEKLSIQDLEVFGNSDFFGIVNFNEDVNIDAGLTVDELTVRNRFEVGVGGTVIRADTTDGFIGIGSTAPTNTLDVIGTGYFEGNVGFGSTIPQQKIDIAGSIKIDENVYDSVNSPAKNGYFFARDIRGVRWLQQLANDDGVMPLSVCLWGGNGNFPPPGYELCDGTNGKPNLAPVTDLNGTQFQYIIKVV